MARLPKPGEDQGAWGGILNEFLSVEHNADGTLKQAADIANKVDSASFATALAAKADTASIYTKSQIDTQLSAKADASATTASLNGKISASIATAKGDIVAASAPNTLMRVGVGADGQVLTADSSQSPGVRWQTPASSSIVSVVGQTGVVTGAQIAADSALVAAYAPSPILETRLKRFRSALGLSNTREIVIRQVGTSIAQFKESPGKYFAEALQRKYGEARSVYSPAASQATNPISGWQAQFYGGPFTVRLRGNVGGGATAITFSRRASSVTIYYGTESDGGAVGVSINGIAQTAISCNGSQSIHNKVTYQLDPSVISTVILTPPSTDYGYLEAFHWEVPTPYGRRGIRFDNLAFGGSGLRNMFAGNERASAAGMATSQSIVGANGIASVFAPTDANVKPDLIVISGPTNDSGVSDTTYGAWLQQVVSTADAAGIDVVFLIEPANGQSYAAGQGGSTAAGQTSSGTAPSTNSWSKLRSQIFSASTNTDAYAVIDWDYNLKYAAFADRYHSLTSLSDPHPTDTGYGDPYRIGGALFCDKFGIDQPERAVADPSITSLMATAITSASEPRFAPVGTLWEDTSNGTGALAILKRKVSSLSMWDTVGAPTQASQIVGGGAHGLWSLVDGAPGASSYAIPGDASLLYNGTSWGTVGALLPGVPSATITSAVDLILSTSNFVAGNYYTLSLVVQEPTTANVSVNVCTIDVRIGNGGNNNAFLDPVTGVFDSVLQVGRVWALYQAGYEPQRYALTFRWPTSGQLTALAGLGCDTSRWHIKINCTSGQSITVAAIQVDPGASAMINKVKLALPSVATATAIGGGQSSTEPAAGSAYMTPGLVWQDTSNGTTQSAIIVKELVEAGSVVPVNTLLGGGTSLWKVRSGSSPDVWFAASSSNASLIAGSGTSVAGSYGPGLPSKGYLVTTPTGGSRTAIEVTASNTALTASSFYTLSMLMKVDTAAGNSSTSVSGAAANIQVKVNNPSNGQTLWLGSDQVTWSSTPANTNPPLTSLNTWYRVSLKFQAYTPAQLVTLNPTSLTFQFRTGVNPGYVCTIADIRLQLGLSVAY